MYEVSAFLAGADAASTSVRHTPRVTRSGLSSRLGSNRTRKATRPRIWRWVQGLVSLKNELSLRGRECSLSFTCFLSPLTGAGVVWGRTSAYSTASVAKGCDVTTREVERTTAEARRTLTLFADKTHQDLHIGPLLEDAVRSWSVPPRR